VRFLNENAFATPIYFFDAEVLRRIEPTGFVERVRVRLAAVLNALFQDARLSRLAEQQATLPAGQAYSLADLFGDVRRGVFAEYRGTPVVDVYRRNLQRSFVEQMDRLLNTPLAAPPSPFPGFAGFEPPPRPGDAQALARLELQELVVVLRGVQPRVVDRATRAHVVQLLARIDQILNPK
jgi:hypothetical protein